MAKITRDNFAEYSPDLQKKVSEQAPRPQNNNAQWFSPKTTEQLKTIRSNTEKRQGDVADPDTESGTDHHSGIRNI